MSTTWLLILAIQYIGIGFIVWYEGRPGLGAMFLCYALANIALIWDIK